MGFMTVDGKEKIGDEPGYHLNHKTVWCPGNEMIDLEMLLPPTEEGFYIPAEFIDKSNLFSCKIMPVGSNPVVFPANAIAHEPDLLFCFVHPGAKVGSGII